MNTRDFFPKTPFRLVLFSVFALLLLGGTFPVAAAWDVWVIGESAKVKPNGDLANDEYMLDNPNYKDTNHAWSRTNNKITIKSARNEYVGFQVIVYADGEDLTTIDLAFSDLTKGGDTLASSTNIEYFQQLYMDIPQASYRPNVKGPGEFPDPLVPSGAGIDGAPYSLSNGRSLPLWVDVHVPTGTAAGLYTGTVTVSAAGKTAEVIDLELTVWAFTVPPQRNLDFFLHFYQNDLAKVYGLGDNWPLQPQTIWGVEQYYFKMAHEHRLQLSPRNAGPYIEFDSNGDITTLSWTQYNNTFGTALDGTLYDDGIGEHVWEVGGNAGDPLKTAGAVTENRESNKFDAIVTHFESQNWLKDKILLTYYWDEPNIAEYQHVEHWSKIQNIASDGKIYTFVTEQPWPLDPAQQQYTDQVERDWGPDLVRRSTAYDGETDPLYPNWTGEKDVKVDIYCPNSKHYFPSDPNIVETAAGARDTGAQVWNYQESEPWIGNQVIDADGLSFRMWPWAAFKYDSEGLFFWCANQWSGGSSGYTDFPAIYTNANTYNLGPTTVFYGDGLLFYPGNVKNTPDNGAVASHRMKQIRRGMIDYEYLYLLRGLGGQSVIDTAYSSTINFNSAYNFYAPSTTLTAGATASDTTITVDSIAHVLKHAEGYDGLKIIGDSPGQDEVVYVTSFVPSTTICNLKNPLQYSHSSGAVVAPMYAPYSFEPTLDYLFGSDGNGRGDWGRNIDNWETARQNIALEIVSLLGGGENDMTAPAQVTDFNADLTTDPSGNIDLTWTAPGDDGSSGTATSYEIRYDTTDPVGANWGWATKVTTPPTPQAAGTTENLTLNGLTPDTAYYFRLYVYDEMGNRSPLSNAAPLATDTDPPVTSSHSPAKGATGVAVSSNIIAHIKDVDSGVDQATIVMTVEGSTVTPTITGTAADYTLTYNPPSDFSSSQVVNVTLDADDLAGNSMTQDAYSFTCASAPDATAPSTSGHNPADGATSVAISTNIVVHVTDGGDGVDQATIVMTVEGSTVTPTISGSSADYTLTYNPPSDFSYDQVVNVTVAATDLASNAMTTDAYSFTCQSDTPQDGTPTVSAQNPAANATSVPAATNIYFEIDGTIQVDSSTLNVTVEGASAISAGVIQSGFGGIISPNSNGFMVLLNPSTDFTAGQVVDVTINASNTSAAPMTQVSYSFTIHSGSATTTSSSSTAARASQFKLCPVGLLLASHPQERAIYVAFRDKYLEPYAWGRKVIDFYYQTFAPKAVAYLNRHEKSQAVWRKATLSFSKVIELLV